MNNKNPLNNSSIKNSSDVFAFSYNFDLGSNINHFLPEKQISFPLNLKKIDELRANKK